MSKYNARRTEIDGYKFDSLAEGRRYQELKLLMSNGNISYLVVHPRFKIVVMAEPICVYVADFKYIDHASGVEIIEDVKGVRTSVYKLKKKLMKVVYGLDITEVSA